MTYFILKEKCQWLVQLNRAQNSVRKIEDQSVRQEDIAGLRGVRNEG